MSEVREGLKEYNGPYDLYERYVAEAAEIDQLLIGEQFEEEELQEVRDYLNELEVAYGNPMLGMQVTICGEYAVRKTDEDGDVLLFLDGTIGQASGEYKGLYIYPMLHDYNDDVSIHTRVLHRIKHEPEIHYDHLGDEHQVTRNTYFSVQGASLETNSVVHSHSFRYLTGEDNWLAGTAAERIDVIASSEEHDAADRTNQLMSYLRTNLADIMRDPALRRNVFSYINSLGLIQNTELLSTVFIYQSADEYHARFSHSNTYHYREVSGITVRTDIRVTDNQVVNINNSYGIFFVINDDEMGQILIPSNPEYTVVVDSEQ